MESTDLIANAVPFEEPGELGKERFPDEAGHVSSDMAVRGRISNDSLFGDGFSLSLDKELKDAAPRPLSTQSLLASIGFHSGPQQQYCDRRDEFGAMLGIPSDEFALSAAQHSHVGNSQLVASGMPSTGLGSNSIAAVAPGSDPDMMAGLLGLQTQPGHSFLSQNMAGHAAGLLGLRSLADQDYPTVSQKAHHQSITEQSEGQGSGQQQEPQGRTATVQNRKYSSPTCQVDGCGLDLSPADVKFYHRRNRVCDQHMKSLSVIVKGQDSRYCQQCHKFHEVAAFDSNKHSCRVKLQKRAANSNKAAEAATPPPPSPSTESPRHEAGRHGRQRIGPGPMSGGPAGGIAARHVPDQAGAVDDTDCGLVNEIAVKQELSGLARSVNAAANWQGEGYLPSLPQFDTNRGGFHMGLQQHGDRAASNLLLQQHGHQGHGSTAGPHMDDPLDMQALLKKLKQQQLQDMAPDSVQLLLLQQQLQQQQGAGPQTLPLRQQEELLRKGYELGMAAATQRDEQLLNLLTRLGEQRVVGVQQQLSLLKEQQQPGQLQSQQSGMQALQPLPGQFQGQHAGQQQQVLQQQLMFSRPSGTAGTEHLQGREMFMQQQRHFMHAASAALPMPEMLQGRHLSDSQQQQLQAGLYHAREPSLQRMQQDFFHANAMPSASPIQEQLQQQSGRFHSQEAGLPQQIMHGSSALASSSSSREQVSFEQQHQQPDHVQEASLLQLQLQLQQQRVLNSSPPAGSPGPDRPKTSLNVSMQRMFDRSAPGDEQLAGASATYLNDRRQMQNMLGMMTQDNQHAAGPTASTAGPATALGPLAQGSRPLQLSSPHLNQAALDPSLQSGWAGDLYLQELLHINSGVGSAPALP